MMVVPVPCKLCTLLKLLMRIFPLISEPVDLGTMATPYGLTSPFAGTVEAIVVIVFARAPGTGAACAALCASTKHAPTSITARGVRFFIFANAPITYWWITPTLPRVPEKTMNYRRPEKPVRPTLNIVLGL